MTRDVFRTWWCLLMASLTITITITILTYSACQLPLCYHCFDNTVFSYCSLRVDLLSDFLCSIFVNWDLMTNIWQPYHSCQAPGALCWLYSYIAPDHFSLMLFCYARSLHVSWYGSKYHRMWCRQDARSRLVSCQESCWACCITRRFWNNGEFNRM